MTLQHSRLKVLRHLVCMLLSSRRCCGHSSLSDTSIDLVLTLDVTAARAGQADSVAEGSPHCGVVCPQTLRHHFRSDASSMETETDRQRTLARWSRMCRIGCVSRRCCRGIGHCTAFISTFDPDINQIDHSHGFDLLLSTLTAVASLCSPLTFIWINLGTSHVSVCADIKCLGAVGASKGSASVCCKAENEVCPVTLGASRSQSIEARAREGSDTGALLKIVPRLEDNNYLGR